VGDHRTNRLATKRAKSTLKVNCQGEEKARREPSQLSESEKKSGRVTSNKGRREKIMGELVHE